MVQVSDHEFVKYLLWFLTEDAEWLEEFADLVDPGSFDQPEINFIAELCLAYWEEMEEPCPFEEWGPYALIDGGHGKSRRLDVDDVMGYYEERKKPSKSMRVKLFKETPEWFKKRKVEQISEEYAALLDEGDTDAAIDFVQEALAQLSSGNTEVENPEEEIFEDVDDSVEDIRKLFSMEWDSTAIRTNISSLDTAMRGGIRAPELGFFLAPTNRGKSQMLVWLACAAFLQNKRVLFISLQMTRERVKQRFFANVCNMTVDDIIHNPDEVAPRVERAKKKHGLDRADVQIIRFRNGEVTVKEIMDYATRARNEGRPYDLIVLDYADLIRPKGTYRSRNDEQKEIYQSLAASAVAFSVPIWTAAQANRDAFTKRHVELRHTGDSIDKARIADWVIGMSQTNEEEKVNVMRLELIKARNAELADCWIETDFAKSRITEIDDPGELL